MPGVQRGSLDRLLPLAEDCVALGVPVMALFPVIDRRSRPPTAARRPTPKAWCRARCAS